MRESDPHRRCYDALACQSARTSVRIMAARNRVQIVFVVLSMSVTVPPALPYLLFWVRHFLHYGVPGLSLSPVLEDLPLIIAAALPLFWTALATWALSALQSAADKLGVTQRLLVCCGFGACAATGYLTSRNRGSFTSAYLNYIQHGTGDWATTKTWALRTIPYGFILLAIVGTTLYTLIAVEDIAESWCARRIWLRDPRRAAFADLVVVVSMLRGDLPFVTAAGKTAGIRRLHRAARSIGRGLPSVVVIGNGPARQVFIDRCRAAGASIDNLALWVALPAQDTHENLSRRLALTIAALTTGRYDELPNDPPLTVTMPQRLRRISGTIRTVVVGVVPLLAAYLARRLGIPVGGALGGGILAFCIAWATVTYLSLLDPRMNEKLKSIGEFFSLLRSASPPGEDADPKK